MTHNSSALRTSSRRQANILEALLQADPSAPALLSSSGVLWSHVELRSAIQYVQAILLEQGIKPGDRVAFAVRRGFEAAWAFLGIISFTTAVPLDPELSDHEREFLLKDAGVRILITDSDVGGDAKRLSAENVCPVISLPAVSSLQLSGDATPPSLMHEHSEVALVLYTSGTTSDPKRVALTHAHLAASCRNIGNAIRFGPTDRCLNPMPLFHTHGLVAGLLAPLIHGGCVILPEVYDTETYLVSIKTHAATCYTAAPTLHHSLAKAVREDPALADDHSLRVIRSASASLAPTVLLELEQHFGVPVIETYGMTEATNQITSNQLPPGSRIPGSAGKPVGTELKIVDKAGLDLPHGQRGEVWIRGLSVVNAYEGNPSATGKAFEDGWLKTGDLGYLDENGYLFLTGRSREVINRGGELIAPRVIDEALQSHPAVDEALTFAIPHPTLGEEIAAAVVLDPSREVLEQELREYMFGRVADHMIPVRIVAIRQLPVNHVGKPQRRILTSQLGDSLTEEYVTPKSPFEVELANIWRDVLGIDRVGRNDNFFLLGGDSLSAARSRQRTADRIGQEITLRDTFRHPVLKDLAWLVFQRALATDTGAGKEQSS